MNLHALVIALALVTPAAHRPPQEWTTDHRDSFLVPPDAKDAEYTSKTIQGADGPFQQEELTYTIAEPYPAPKFIADLKKQLEQKGWTEDIQTGTNLGSWDKPPYDRSRPFECLWLMPWKNSNSESVSYWLQYKSAQDPHLRVLHVHAYYSLALAPPPQAPPAPPTPDPSRLHQRLLGLGFLVVYLLILAGLIRLLVLPRVRAALFYAGHGSWLTTTNLILLSPSFLFLLSIGGIVVAAVGPASGDTGRDAAIASAVLLWAFIAVCAGAGLIACPIVVLLTASILYVESIPKKVKVGHAVLGLLSLTFWICITCSRSPLIRW